MQGKLLSYPKSMKAKIRDQQIKISYDSDVFIYSFGKCQIFDTSRIDFENRQLKLSPVKFRVYDDFELSCLGAKHRFLEQKKEGNTGLAYKINFYASDRVDGANYITDCVVESCLDSKQINHVDYSDSMVRFYVKRHLEKIGVKGTFMALYKSGEPKYRKPKITHVSRVVVPFDESEYEDSENVKFRKLSLREVFDEVCT
jgi:hypothetical protein